MFLADLHVHSNFSDGVMSVPELVDFYGKQGFGCIAITDHVCESNTILGLAAKYMRVTLNQQSFPTYLQVIREQAERAWSTYRMVVLPGFEITKNSLSNHRSAHILGIGINAFINPNLDVVTIAREIRAQGGLAVAAHPVPTGRAELQTLHLWSKRHVLAQEFDAWEVASGRDLFLEVKNSGLPMIATSDLHHAKQIVGWKSLFKCERDPVEIIKSVRKQSLSFDFYTHAFESKPVWAPTMPEMSLC